MKAITVALWIGLPTVVVLAILTTVAAVHRWGVVDALSRIGIALLVAGTAGWLFDRGRSA